MDVDLHILVTWTVDSDANILELGKTMTKEMSNAWNAGQPQMVITDQENALASTRKTSEREVR